MELSKNEILDRIEQLFLTSDRINVELALSLAKGQSIPVEELPIAQTYQWIEKHYPQMLRYSQVDSWKDKIEWTLNINRLNIIPKIGLDPCILYLRKLYELKINDSAWEALPDYIFSLPKLKTLSLKRCAFLQFPENIKNIQLSQLELSGWKNDKLPKKIEKIKQLSQLNIELCNLTQFPEEILEINGLTALRAQQNKFQSLPANLHKAKGLETLQLQSNQLSQLPPSIAQLPKLDRLNLRNNRFTKFPADLSGSPNLRVLTLDYNQLSQIPMNINLPQLETLILNDNNFSKFPTEIAQFPNLKVVYLADNQISELPQNWSPFEHLEIHLERNSIPTANLPKNVAI